MEKVTKATGIDKVVKAVAGDDCGCQKRKEALNRWFPYFNLFSEADKALWENELQPRMRNGEQWPVGLQTEVIDLYERTFKKRVKKTKCGPCVMQRMEELQKVYEASCES